MLGVQTAGGREAPADGADGKRGTAQYAKGGVAERGDALGVQILAQHVANPDFSYYPVALRMTFWRQNKSANSFVS